MADNDPKVRIGMIQSAGEVKFSVTTPFSITDLQGNEITCGQPDKLYTVHIASAKPAKLRYRVRLAIAEDDAGVVRAQKALNKKYSPLSILHPGLVINLPDKTIDNREYWLVTDAFQNLESARTFQQNYEPVGQAVVVSEVMQKASGEVVCENHRITDGLRIIPLNEEQARIKLENVIVGIEFHWQHLQTEELEGVLEVNFNHAGKLVAINEIGIEDYLASVNSSEMTAECPAELLKAQTIAARSTILATMGKHHYGEEFHLCADDHCQCYHGAANVTEISRKAAVDTWGENLLYNGAVCDARYAKICGGVMESFPYVWDDREIPYLIAGVDGVASIAYPLDSEEKAKDYVDSSPDVYCNTSKYPIAASLPYNSKDLFRWQVSYSRSELQELMQRKIGEEFGELIDLQPVQRGPSGRLVYLDVIGSKKTIRIGKELAIRRALSDSHLYSSCFYIIRERDATGAISRFTLKGAGWGHGVGLCQVGATVMAQQGFNYKRILEHYYKGAKLKKLY